MNKCKNQNDFCKRASPPLVNKHEVFFFLLYDIIKIYIGGDNMSLDDLLEKDSLTSEEKNRLIELICEKEKKFEGITFGVINMPKKKYKLFKRKKDSDVLGIQVTTIKDGVPTFNVAITEEETPLVVFLNTIYHEIEHVKQKDKLLTARYPLSINMILTKEFLASLNKVYYKSNYNKLVTEINARLMGRK